MTVWLPSYASKPRLMGGGDDCRRKATTGCTRMTMKGVSGERLHVSLDGINGRRRTSVMLFRTASYELSYGPPIDGELVVIAVHDLWRYILLGADESVGVLTVGEIRPALTR
ncbi:hypothetical protein E2542_SST04841 [Spatholobus suberectus]|nr:hypothetical protein E2542_SST04841 [Spatholobus suberectus]